MVVDFTPIFSVFLTTLLPIAELRGSIPLGVALGIDPIILLPFVIITNTLIFFPVYFIFNWLYSKVEHIEWVRRHKERLHSKGSRYVEKYGIIGLAIFTGMPLPLTGVYTGSIIARLLGLEWKRSLLAVFFGVLIATTIVTLTVYGFIGGVSLLNRIH